MLGQLGKSSVYRLNAVSGLMPCRLTGMLALATRLQKLAAHTQTFPPSASVCLLSKFTACIVITMSMY